jgi:shikimate dehydrogenase
MKYGLIGEKLGHSFSKTIHEKLADYTYELKELKENEVEGFLKAKEFEGINVTIPYKQTVFPYLDVISKRAEKIGAVNTIVKKGGKLYGDNTDYLGMKALIERVCGDIEGKKVLILGSGGTSKTAKAVAEDFGASNVIRVSRSGKDGAITYEEAYGKHADAQILINTTPAGMYPNTDGCAVDLDRLPNLTGVIDAIYNPLRSVLVIKAQERGISAEGGLFMLVAQAVYAAEQFADMTFEEGTIEKVFGAEMNEKRNIVLTGMPKAGKTTVGKMLAKNLNLEFVDTDKLIVDREKREITEIFAKEGEDYFRKVEAEVIAEVSLKNGLVIATGGGAVLRPENVLNLKKNGQIFFLNRPVDELTPSRTRPLAGSVDKILKLFKERYSVYKSTCDHMVVNNVSAADAVERIKEILSGRKNILVLNGPNLNMLGVREPDIYGFTTYSQLCELIDRHAKELRINVTTYQSNSEGDLVTKIQEAYGKADGIVINPGAYTHTSVALLDALKAVQIPTVEVHISEVSKRENFRQISYVRAACMATITGHGVNGYLEAIDLLVKG